VFFSTLEETSGFWFLTGFRPVIRIVSNVFSFFKLEKLFSELEVLHLLSVVENKDLVPCKDYDDYTKYINDTHSNRR